MFSIQDREEGGIKMGEFYLFGESHTRVLLYYKAVSKAADLSHHVVNSQTPCLGNWPTWLPLYIIQSNMVAPIVFSTPPCGKCLNYGFLSACGFDADKVRLFLTAGT